MIAEDASEKILRALHTVEHSWAELTKKECELEDLKNVVSCHRARYLANLYDWELTVKNCTPGYVKSDNKNDPGMG